jgi:hypothetical protein
MTAAAASVVVHFSVCSADRASFWLGISFLLIKFLIFSSKNEALTTFCAL